VLSRRRTVVRKLDTLVDHFAQLIRVDSAYRITEDERQLLKKAIFKDGCWNLTNQELEDFVWGTDAGETPEHLAKDYPTVHALLDVFLT
jgi:hypothetical protein